MFDLSMVSEVSTTQNVSNYSAATFGFSLGFYVLMAIALWPVFTKAGLKGWGALIPIVSVYLLVKIARYHGALTILYFIPVVNVVVGILVALRCGHAFGRSAVFSIVLLWLLSPVGYFIIGYGRSAYDGDLGRQTTQLAQ